MHRLNYCERRTFIFFLPIDMVNKLLAAITGVTLSLTAVPAFAMELGVTTSTTDATISDTVDASVTSKAHFRGPKTTMLRRLFSADRMKELREKCDGDDNKECMLRLNKAGKVNAGIQAETKMTPAEKEEKMNTHVMHTAERLVNHLAKMTKRLCSANSPDDTTAKACVMKMGANFKLKFSAMIDAAFGL